MKTIFDEIEDHAAGIYAIWNGLNAAAVKTDKGDIDDFRIRGLLDLLCNASERLEMLARDHREINRLLAEEKKQLRKSCH